MERLRVELPRDLTERVTAAARSIGATPHAYVGGVLQQHVPPLPSPFDGKVEAGLKVLETYLDTLPGLQVMSSGKQGSLWWIKFSIDIDTGRAWSVVQNLGFVLNYISLSDLLPTVFKPVSPPPYLNGGPREMLAWVIESTVPFVDPAEIAGILSDRLPEAGQTDRWRDGPGSGH